MGSQTEDKNENQVANEIHNPHDNLFKREFQNGKISKDVVKASVPDVVRDRIDWQTLRCTGQTYVDEELQGYVSDIVFSAMFDEEDPLEIIILMEVESVAKHDFLIRFQRYVALAIEKIYYKNPQKKKNYQPSCHCVYTKVSNLSHTPNRSWIILRNLS